MHKFILYLLEVLIYINYTYVLQHLYCPLSTNVDAALIQTR